MLAFNKDFLNSIFLTKMTCLNAEHDKKRNCTPKNDKPSFGYVELDRNSNMEVILFLIVKTFVWFCE